jgi:hypothetical protein
MLVISMIKIIKEDIANSTITKTVKIFKLKISLLDLLLLAMPLHIIINNQVVSITINNSRHNKPEDLHKMAQT